jgi:hypothetical protein
VDSSNDLAEETQKGARGKNEADFKTFMTQFSLGPRETDYRVYEMFVWSFIGDIQQIDVGKYNFEIKFESIYDKFQVL